jgi:hypothetical protein
MDEREMVKKIWAVLFNLLDPGEDYNVGRRWVKDRFKREGWLPSTASSKRFDKAWLRVRGKMKNMAK